MFNLVLALLAGFVTVATPCTLPMLPILLGASAGQNSNARPAMIALGFVLSFSAVALLLSAITNFFDFDPSDLRSGAAILLVGFGLLMIWPAPFQWLSTGISGLRNGSAADATTSLQGNIGGFVLGTTLGLVWTPCAGPVLGSILTVVATSSNTTWASTLLVVYATGAAIPMLAIAYGGQAVTTRVRRANHAEAAAGVWRHRDRIRDRGLFSIRHADPGVADRILPKRPDRPLNLLFDDGDDHDDTIIRYVRLGDYRLSDWRGPARRQRRDHP